MQTPEHNTTHNARMLLIRTGGTIDACAYDDPHNPPSIVATLVAEDSLIASTIETIGFKDSVDMFSWGTRETQFVKDSQLFSEADIEALADVIATADQRHIIITHGTDAMAHNARMLQSALAQRGSDKVVVFTGAMVPLSMQDKHASDGVRALEHAIQNVQALGAGVHVLARDTHSQRLTFFEPQNVEKNKPASKQDLVFTVSAAR